ncbi:MAG TPA: NAD-dependent epimerase/dehydratase family protein [Planctomycetaceae bacterium]|nr:NAD-dependent epimerase/dehydratase family protein [Planctomycetaceae bacterium]
MPGRIETEDELEAALSEPTPAVIDALRRLPGDIMLLGVAGKMGPSLAHMVRRASDAAGIPRRVIGVSRFSSGGQSQFAAQGIETIACDLLDESAVAQLPDVANIVFMAGKKFGATGHEATTWAINSYLPGVVCRKFRQSRIVAFSTGNVYGLTPIGGGSVEDDPPAPVGEYAMSALGRERVFEYFSRGLGIRMSIIRLNYACDLRYGVLVDLAGQVLAEQPIDLAMGHFNTIWQGDANAMALCAFAHAAAPPLVVNVTGAEVLSVRTVCERFGQIMNKKVSFTGAESETALLSKPARAVRLMGLPRLSADELIDRVAWWTMAGGRNLGKPTHFESRSGRF